MMTFTLELVRPLDRKIVAFKKKYEAIQASGVHACCDSLLFAGRLILRSIHEGFKLRWRRHLHLHHPSISVGTLVHLALEVISDMSRDKQLELA